MKIFSIGDYYAEVVDSPPNLKALLAQESGQSFRRIDRFIQLALIGVTRCVKSISLPLKTAVYLTSGQGDLDITIDVMENMYKRGEAPKPLSFINTVSNAACFTIARYLGLHGASNFVTSHNFAFERVLELAYLECSVNPSSSVLIGSVDICSASLSDHRQRLRLSQGSAVAEASHWWFVANDCGQSNGIAEVLAIKHFNSEQQLLLWLQLQTITDDWCISGGQYLGEKNLIRFQQQFDIKKRFDYCQELAFYNTQSGSALYRFIHEGNSGTLLHLNTDADGRYCVFLLQTTD